MKSCSQQGVKVMDEDMPCILSHISPLIIIPKTGRKWANAHFLPVFGIMLIWQDKLASPTCPAKLTTT
jgi:hypothetical protein